MTLAEILQVFDSVEFDHAAYPAQPGTVKCCGLPVVQHPGTIPVSQISCSQCHRTVSEVGRQWMVTEWGSRGIKIFPSPTAADIADRFETGTDECAQLRADLAEALEALRPYVEMVIVTSEQEAHAAAVLSKHTADAQAASTPRTNAP